MTCARDSAERSIQSDGLRVSGGLAGAPRGSPSQAPRAEQRDGDLPWLAAALRRSGSAERVPLWTRRSTRRPRSSEPPVRPSGERRKSAGKGPFPAKSTGRPSRMPRRRRAGSACAPRWLCAKRHVSCEVARRGAWSASPPGCRTALVTTARSQAALRLAVASAVDLAAAIDAFLSQPDLAATTRAKYRQTLTVVEDELGDAPVTGAGDMEPPRRDRPILRALLRAHPDPRDRRRRRAAARSREARPHPQHRAREPAAPLGAQRHRPA